MAKFRVLDKQGRLRRDSDGIWGRGPSPHYGVRYNLVPPIKRHFSSQSTGTLTQSPYGLLASAPPQASLANLRIWDKAITGGPWRITAALCPLLYPETAVHHCGILLRETSSARLHSISIWDDGTLTVSRWTSPTLFSSNDVAATSFPGIIEIPRFLSLKADSVGNYFFELSDGFGNYQNLYSIAVGSWLTADRIGFYVNAGSLNVTAVVTLLSWQRTAE